MILAWDQSHRARYVPSPNGLSLQPTRATERNIAVQNIPGECMQIKKSMKAQMLPDNLNVNITVTETQSGSSRSVSVPVSAAEFMVVAEMCKYMIPRFLGLDKLQTSVGNGAPSSSGISQP